MSILLVSGVCTLLVSGCGSVKKSEKPDYRSTTTRPPLEIPPDLNRTSSRSSASVPAGTDGTQPATASAYESQSQSASGDPDFLGNVLPSFKNVRMLRSGDERWLEVDSTPEDLWPLVIDFWVKDQIRLVTENPATGVMETDWLENYAEISTTAQRWFRRVFGSLITADSYDKFRVRLERSRNDGKTELFLAHRAISAEAVKTKAARDVIDTRWVPGQSNPDLEAEMLRLMMMHLGLNDTEIAQVVAAPVEVAPDRARLERGDNGSRIIVDDDLNTAWRRVALALDRIGFTVLDRDKASGVFSVRSVDPTAAEKAGKETWLGRLFTRDQSVEVKSKVVLAATDVDSQTEVRVVEEDGNDGNEDKKRKQGKEEAEAIDRIVELLFEQLK